MKNNLLQDPINPFLLAFYPVLFFYSQNINEAFIQQAVLSLLISIVITIISWLFLLIIYRNQGKAALVTSAFLLVFFSHGHIKSIIGPLNFVFGRITIGEDKILTAIWLILLSWIFFQVYRSKSIVHKLTPALNIFISTIMMITLVQVTTGLINGSATLKIDRQTSGNTLGLQTQVANQNLKNLPDIYYIILDKYAGNPTLKRYYNYDNSDFTNYLSNKGFYVAYDSKTNYPRTSYSLASSLNMEYLDTLAQEMGVDVIAENPELKVVFPKLQNHKVWQLLQPYGYRYYQIGSWYEPTRLNAYATESYVFNSSKIQLDEFTMRFLGTTLVTAFADRYLPLDLETQHRLSILFGFNKLIDTSALPGPKFVFAHILSPHGPYMLDSRCDNLDLHQGEQSNIQQYIGQMRCTNLRMEQIVTQILATAVTPPIIIIQSDEGPNTHAHDMPHGDYTFAGTSPGAIIERTRIQNAYYFPDHNYARLYQTISPVNSFRVIFSQYYDKNFPLYPDVTHITETEEDIYNFSFTIVDPQIFTDK